MVERPKRRSSQSFRAVSVAPDALQFDVMNAARRLVVGSLGVVRGESILLIADRERKDMVAVLEHVALEIGASVTVLFLDDIGPRPHHTLPPAIAEAMTQSQASALLCGYDAGELTMRREIGQRADDLRLRHAHMVGLTARSLVPGFSIDPQRILDTTRTVRMRLRPDSTLRVRSPAGTDLEVELDPSARWWECSGVVRPGRWENFPSGRLSTTPARIEGVFVADGSVAESFGAQAGLLRHTPVAVEIAQGMLRTVRCADRNLERAIDEYLHSEANGTRIGLVHIGTNVGLREPLGEIICDLNLPGLHIGFGTPHSTRTGADWDSRVQLAMSGAAQDVDVDGAPLVRAARYLTA
jgi:leucyl aminopeptidase (aminopeptidase T)